MANYFIYLIRNSIYSNVNMYMYNIVHVLRRLYCMVTHRTSLNKTFNGPSYFSDTLDTLT